MHPGGTRLVPAGRTSSPSSGFQNDKLHYRPFSSMERVTCRLKGTGTIGFVRAVTPCSLQSLRQCISEQISASLPRSGFRFLVGGVPVSLVQEEGEDYHEGDVLIAALPPDAGSESASSEMPARPPAQTLVSQWLDVFAFLSVHSPTVTCTHCTLLRSCRHVIDCRSISRRPFLCSRQGS